MILSTYKFCCKLTKIGHRGWVSANATMLMHLATYIGIHFKALTSLVEMQLLEGPN